MLNNTVVQDNWPGACAGRTGNVRYSPKATHHSCEENGLNRWHCILSRLEYEIRKTRNPSVAYISPDAVDYPAVVKMVIKPLEQSNTKNNLVRPNPNTPIQQLLQIQNPNQMFPTVHAYMLALYQKASTGSDSSDLVQSMDTLRVTKEFLKIVGDIAALRTVRTRLVNWCKSVYILNPNMRRNIEVWGREKDASKSILKLVMALDKRKPPL